MNWIEWFEAGKKTNPFRRYKSQLTLKQITVKQIVSRRKKNHYNLYKIKTANKQGSSNVFTTSLLKQVTSLLHTKSFARLQT